MGFGRAGPGDHRLRLPASPAWIGQVLFCLNFSINDETRCRASSVSRISRVAVTSSR